MEKQRRREAVQAYKEKKVLQGIFAVRCSATGETWLGMSRNLDAQQNSIWFSLRMGTHRNKPLQAAWKNTDAQWQVRHEVEAAIYRQMDELFAIRAKDTDWPWWRKKLIARRGQE